MKKPIDKTIPLTITFLVAIIGVSLYLTLGSAQITCEVCMEYEGVRGCKTVSGESREFIIQTASNNVCAQLGRGRDEQISCGRRPPVKVECRGSM